MKLGSVNKPDKRNKTTSKKIDGDVILEYSDVIAIFPIYVQFGAIRKTDSGYKTSIFINSNISSHKTENRTK